MKMGFSGVRAKRRRAFTALELVLVIGALTILVAMYLPSLARSSRRSSAISCTNNQKQIGLGFKIFANDHADRFPMQVWPDQMPPSALSVQPSFIFRAMSNDLSTPLVLVCPKDNRKPASSFSSLSSSNISYFIGLNAVENYPQMILAGDRNLTVGGVQVGPGLLAVTTNTVLGWSATMHEHTGNLTFSDGSVQQTSQMWLHEYARKQGCATNWLAIP